MHRCPADIATTTCAIALLACGLCVTLSCEAGSP